MPGLNNCVLKFAHIKKEIRGTDTWELPRGRGDYLRIGFTSLEIKGSDQHYRYCPHIHPSKGVI